MELKKNNCTIKRSSLYESKEHCQKALSLHEDSDKTLEIGVGVEYIT